MRVSMCIAKKRRIIVRETGLIGVHSSTSMFFTGSYNYPIGLDISELSLKLVQLKKTGDKITIQALSKVGLPEGLFENGEIRDKGKIIEAINSLIGKPKYGTVTTKEVVACLPESRTFIKLIEVKKTENKNIAEAIEAEIEKHVPMEINEIYFDWQVIKDFADKQLILVGAAPRRVVNQYISLLDEAKLSIAALEIEPVALCRCLLAEENYKFKEQGKNYGIIDIGAKRSNMTVYAKNTILFSFTMPISGNEITKKIAETLSIDAQKAEKAKIVCGLDKNKAKGVIKATLEGMIKELTAKINDSILFYERHFPDYGELDKILLCGGGANVKNLDKILSKRLSIEVETGNVLTNLNENETEISKIFSETHSFSAGGTKGKNKSSRITQNNGAAYATAVGLALRELFIGKL